jgi:preprotein translocase subunit SecB
MSVHCVVDSSRLRRRFLAIASSIPRDCIVDSKLELKNQTRMITYLSDLKTNSFYIIKSSCELIVPKSEIDPHRVSLAYPVDLDYSVQERQGGRTFRVLMELSINYPAKDPGYSIFIEAMGDFAIDTDREVSPVERERLINYTAVETVINHIRGYIANITSQYPLGRYLFASVNMDALYRAKQEQLKKIKTSESKIQKS